MPFPFVLPTTSSFSFSSCFACDSHPSLPLSASTYRGVVRDTLKKHKALPAASKASSLGSVISSLEAYVPYLLAIDAGLCNQPVPVAGLPGGGGGSGTTTTTSTGELVDVILKTTPCMAWRPTICAELVPGRERSRRVKAASLEHEIGFALSALAAARVLAARAALQPLYSTTTEFLGARERTAAVTAATRELLAAAAVYEFLVARGEQPDVVGPPPSADIAPAALRALACLALAEATLLAVLKDDPYPAAVAQDRNRNDKEWMFRSPEIPKVRAHLFARLCLAASEHAAKALSLCQAAGSGSGSGRISPALLKYMEDLRRTSRAKACRFFGIDAELGGETAEGIAWMRAGLQELGAQAKDAKKGGLSLSRLKKDFEERREDRRVDKETAWGADAGRLEEIRILEMLDAKWNKINDTMNTRPIPPVNSRLAKMPSGRDIHTIKPYQPPCLDRDVLESMRAPPDGDDVFGDEASSDDDDGSRPLAPIGAFPGSAAEYGRSSTPGSSYY